MNLYEELAGPLAEERRFIRIVLADGATWLVPLKFVVDATTAYYESAGWYDEDDEEEQPVGEELRGLVFVNDDHAQSALEIHWRQLRDHAQHISGPMTEPPDDKLWAVDEQDGSIELATDIPPEQQMESAIVLLWYSPDLVPAN